MSGIASLGFPVQSWKWTERNYSLPFLNLVVLIAKANKRFGNSISLWGKDLERANLINCTNLILNSPVLFHSQFWGCTGGCVTDLEYKLRLGKRGERKKGKERKGKEERGEGIGGVGKREGIKKETSLKHDKAPDHQCFLCLMCYVNLSWPTNADCFFIIWHFFSLKAEVSVLS